MNQNPKVTIVMKTPILTVILFAVAATLLRAQPPSENVLNGAPAKEAPSAAVEIRDKVPVLGDIPVIARLFRNEWSHPSDWTASAAANNVGPIIAFGQLDQKTLDELTEDLSILGFIFNQNIDRALGEEKPDYRLGVPMLLKSGGRLDQASYVEGVGAFFNLRVQFPLVAPPTAEPEKEATPANLEWDKARRALFANASAAPAGRSQAPYNEAEHYDARLVEVLKKQVIESLRNASNLRHVKPNEWIVVTITGGPTPPTKEGADPSLRQKPQGLGTSVPTGNAAGPETLAVRNLLQNIPDRLPNTNESQGQELRVFALQNANAEDVAKQLQEHLNQLLGGNANVSPTPFSVVADRRINAVVVSAPRNVLEDLDKMVKALDELGHRELGRSTIMTIRVKKAAADSGEHFERKAEVNTYLGIRVPVGG
jgi:hypothetical protein